MSGDRRWTRIFRPDPRREVEEELALHLEQRAADYIARGMDPEAARAAAAHRLGDLHDVKRECTELLTSERRSEKRREWVSLSWLDFKLGFRMLVRYPGLTVVAGLAMAFAIWVGAGTFEFVSQVMYPRIPLDEGHRVVGLRLWDAASARVERQATYDFVRWREQLTSIEHAGAFRNSERNLDVEGSIGPVRVAEVTASAFPAAKGTPLLGRTLNQSDETAGAPAVVVIGYDMWQKRFSGRNDAIGRTVRLGGAETAVVGVMPEGFRFPVSDELWVPLRLDALTSAPRAGAPIQMFGRLADGATLETAQAELDILGARAAADRPDTHRHLRPQVMRYAKSILDISGWSAVFVMSANLFLIALLILVCANVALLMFARAASRESEITVRNALGASRARIIAQLFAEALVLGTVAAVVGLAGVTFGLRWGLGIMESEHGALPFWFSASLSPATIGYTALLTVFGAVIAGVMPAMKVTRGIEARLREARSGLQFGGVWTVVIVAQVAATVVFPMTTFVAQGDRAKLQNADLGFATANYVMAPLGIGSPSNDGTVQASNRSFNATFGELGRRLASDPAVADVTYGDRLPGMYHPHSLAELDAGPAAPLHPQWAAYRISTANVDPGFFNALGVAIEQGRNFTSADAAPDQLNVIVNRSFVERVLGNANPIGRRVRLTYHEEQEDRSAPPGPWMQIVGVVRDLGTASDGKQWDPKVAAVYRAALPENADPLHIVLHMRGDATTYAPRLRQIAASVDPSLRVYDPVAFDDIYDPGLRFMNFWFILTILVSAVALLLSLAGMYAVTAFAVSRRTREIGIRVALGSGRRQLLASVFARPVAQAAGGIVAGAAIICLLMVAAEGGALSLTQILAIAAYALLMLLVCMLACVVPTRRALRIQPTDAMRMEL